MSSSWQAAEAAAEAVKGSLPRPSPDAPTGNHGPQLLANPHRRAGGMLHAQQPARGQGGGRGRQRQPAQAKPRRASQQPGAAAARHPAQAGWQRAARPAAGQPLGRRPRQAGRGPPLAAGKGCSHAESKSRAPGRERGKRTATQETKHLNSHGLTRLGGFQLILQRTNVLHAPTEPGRAGVQAFTTRHACNGT